MSRYSVSAVFKAVDQFSATIARMSSGVGKLLSQTRAGLATVSAMNAKVHQTLTATGVAMAAAGTGAAFAIGNVVKTGADFEQAITAVGAVGLQTRKQIAALEKQALELGGSTQFSATQVANAMETMARAGFSNAEIMAGVPGFSRLRLAHAKRLRRDDLPAANQAAWKKAGHGRCMFEKEAAFPGRGQDKSYLDAGAHTLGTCALLSV